MFITATVFYRNGKGNSLPDLSKNLPGIIVEELSVSQSSPAGPHEHDVELFFPEVGPFDRPGPEEARVRIAIDAPRHSELEKEPHARERAIKDQVKKLLPEGVEVRVWLRLL